jgi:hypothetical protein
MYFKKSLTEHQTNSDLTNGCVLVTFWAKTAELLPKFNRIGDIIRIHRANIGQYRNHKTFMCNVDYGTTWAIFKGASLDDQDNNLDLIPHES